VSAITYCDISFKITDLRQKVEVRVGKGTNCLHLAPYVLVLKGTWIQGRWCCVVKILPSDDKCSTGGVKAREGFILIFLRACSVLCKILLLCSENSDSWSIQNFTIKNNVLLFWANTLLLVCV